MTRLPYTYQAARNLFPNHEAQYYSDSSVGENPFSISGGVLSITASLAAPGSNPYSLPYDSGIITSKTSLGQLYGYFETRAQLPAGAGFWPGFWFKPVDGTSLAELDAFEVLGQDPTNVHFSTHDRSSGTDVTQTRVITGANTSTGFHTYGVDWEPTTLTLFVDGSAVASMPTPASMNKPMFMLLQLAVGGVGSWPGAPTSNAEFPAAMKIDYVRAYATPNTVNVTGSQAISGGSFTPFIAPPAPAGAGGSFTLNGNGAIAVRGDGNWQVSGTPSNATLTLGNGNDSVKLTGSGNAVSIGTGTSLVQINGAQNRIHAAGGALTINATGIYNTITVGTGSGDIRTGDSHANITLNSASSGSFAVHIAGIQNLVTAVAHTLAIDGGSGSSTFLLASDAAAEASNAASGAGTRQYSVTSWGTYNTFRLFDSVHNTIVTGAAAAVYVSDPASASGAAAGSDGLASSSLSLHGLNNRLYDTGRGNLTVTGGTGQGTFALGDGSNSLTTGGTGNIITAGAGTDTINAGSGSASVTLNGSNVFATLNGTGNRIRFQAGAHGIVDDRAQGLRIDIASANGVIALRNLAQDATAMVTLFGGVGGYTNTAQIVAALHADGAGGTTLNLGAGSIDFVGLAASQIHASMFAIKA